MCRWSQFPSAPCLIELILMETSWMGKVFLLATRSGLCMAVSGHEARGRVGTPWSCVCPHSLFPKAGHKAGVRLPSEPGMSWRCCSPTHPEFLAPIFLARTTCNLLASPERDCGHPEDQPTASTEAATAS